MEHAEYIYTEGMDKSELEERLRAGHHGVLGLADGTDSYAIPLSYHYDGDRLVIRISRHDGDSEKRQFIRTTETATFVCYTASERDSWSIQIRGPVQKLDDEIDETTLNEWFPPFRLFDEAVNDVAFELYELQMDSVIGRQTI